MCACVRVCVAGCVCVEKSQTEQQLAVLPHLCVAVMPWPGLCVACVWSCAFLLRTVLPPPLSTAPSSAPLSSMLDSSYVSSLSWYFIVMFGLRGFLSLFMTDDGQWHAHDCVPLAHAMYMYMNFD